MARVVRSFSLDSEKNKDIIEKLDAIPNRSNYIISLIKRDLENTNGLFSEEQKLAIKDIVYQILNEYKIDNNSINKLDKETEDAINNLLNM
ncbi:MAG: hypothetical protein ACLS9F_19305 [Clostridium paraputrificum]